MAGLIKIEEVIKTLIVVVLDESGSMEEQKSDVIGGYNSFIERQREITEDKARLVLVKFNDKVNIAHSVMALAEVPRLDKNIYMPSGATALYDAISESIRFAEMSVQAGERVLILIMTDLEENCSKKATATEIKDMIKSHEDLGNWTFAYIGQNPDGWANKVSGSKTNAAGYVFLKQRQNFDAADSAVSNYRACRELQKTTEFFTDTKK